MIMIINWYMYEYIMYILSAKFIYKIKIKY